MSSSTVHLTLIENLANMDILHSRKKEVSFRSQTEHGGNGNCLSPVLSTGDLAVDYKPCAVCFLFTVSLVMVLEGKSEGWFLRRII